MKEALEVPAHGISAPTCRSLAERRENRRVCKNSYGGQTRIPPQIRPSTSESLRETTWLRNLSVDKLADAQICCVILVEACHAANNRSFFAWKWDIKAAAGIGPFLSDFSSS
jgi:hypothetical protein